jgi:hypothetical protein
MDHWLVGQQSLGNFFFPAMITLWSTKIFIFQRRTDRPDSVHQALTAMLLRIEGQTERYGKRVMAQHFKQVTWVDQFDGCAC